MSFRLLAVDVAFLVVGAGLTVWGLILDIGPIDKARSQIAELTLGIQRLDNQLIELRQIDADFLQAETYELMLSFVDANTKAQTFHDAVAQVKGSRLRRPLLGMLANSITDTDDKERVTREFQENSNRISAFIEDLRKSGAISSDFQAYIKQLTSKFLDKLERTILAKDVALQSREVSRQRYDKYSLWSGLLKTIGFVVLLVATLIGSKIIEGKVDLILRPRT